MAGLNFLSFKWARRLVPRSFRKHVGDWHTRRLWQLDLDRALVIVEEQLRKQDYQTARRLIDALLVRHPRDQRLVHFSKRVSNTYDDHFFAGQNVGSLSSARIILSILARHVELKNLVDIGAGMGTWLASASELGAQDCVAVDGEWVRNALQRNPGCRYIFQDLNQPLKISGRFSCAICVEVAEHLDPERGPSLVRELCNLSDLVLFGAALPRQSGSGHINCRPHEYWTDQFSRCGHVCLDAIRPETWNDPRVEPCYSQNSFIFAHRDRVDLLSIFPRATLLSVYHPKLVNELVLADNAARESRAGV